MKARLAAATLLLITCNGTTSTIDAGHDATILDSGPVIPPDQIFGGLAQWLDADDPPSVLAQNNIVDEWKDRSGNAFHVVSVKVGSGVSFVPQVANGHGALRVGPQRGILKSSGGPSGGFFLLAVVAARRVRRRSHRGRNARHPAPNRAAELVLPKEVRNGVLNAHDIRDWRISIIAGALLAGR